jgi:deoxyribodipyrimidine photolyase
MTPQPSIVWFRQDFRLQDRPALVAAVQRGGPVIALFIPVLQGEKFDPHGHYVRRWAPMLQHLPHAWIHKPWPIVDHAWAR